MDECEPWTFPISSVGTSPVSSQDSVLSNVHSTSSLDGLATSHGYATQEVNLEILVQMMNSSLQTMMSGNKPVRPGGIVLSSDAGYPKLAAISPDLFSPGYVKVQSIIRLLYAADGPTPGGFTTYCSTAHNST